MYVVVSSCARRIDAKLEVFRPDQLRVLNMDDLRDRPEATLRAVSARIGVDWYPPFLSENPPEERQRRTKGGHRRLSRAQKL